MYHVLLRIERKILYFQKQKFILKNPFNVVLIEILSTIANWSLYNGHFNKNIFNKILKVEFSFTNSTIFNFV